MAIYKDKAGHFTSKDNEGGECRHGVAGKTAKLKGPEAYAEWARSVNPEATDKDILEGMADKYEDIDVPYDEEEDEVFDDEVDFEEAEESKPTATKRAISNEVLDEYYPESERPQEMKDALNAGFKVTALGFGGPTFERDDGTKIKFGNGGSVTVTKDGDDKEYSASEIRDAFDYAIGGKEDEGDAFDKALADAFEKTDGDEDDMLDILRRTDWGIDDGDLQGIVESYAERNSTKSKGSASSNASKKQEKEKIKKAMTPFFAESFISRKELEPLLNDYFSSPSIDDKGNVTYRVKGTRNSISFLKDGTVRVIVGDRKIDHHPMLMGKAIYEALGRD